MNKHIQDYNRLGFNSANEKLEPNFPYQSIDLESSLEKNEMIFGKQSLLYRINKNNEMNKQERTHENGLIKIESLCDTKNGSNLIARKQNNISYLNDKSEDNDKYLKKNKMIFKIEKKNKKIGRMKKNSFFKGIHNKYSEDNIIRKIKGRFHEKLRLYINEEYKKYILNKSFQKKKITVWLKKIEPKVSRKIKKEENLKWFETKIFEVFSEKVSSRYTSYSQDTNKKKIERLFSINQATNVIDILNNDIETLFNKYINDEKIEGFKTLKDDIEELKSQLERENQGNFKEYLNKYEYIAKNMKKIFTQKIPRKINNEINEK